MNIDLSISAAVNARACVRESYVRRLPWLNEYLLDPDIHPINRGAVVNTVQWEADAINAITEAVIRTCGGPA